MQTLWGIARARTAKEGKTTANYSQLSISIALHDCKNIAQLLLFHYRRICGAVPYPVYCMLYSTYNTEQIVKQADIPSMLSWFSSSVYAA